MRVKHKKGLKRSPTLIWNVSMRLVGQFHDSKAVWKPLHHRCALAWSCYPWGHDKGSKLGLKISTRGPKRPPNFVRNMSQILVGQFSLFENNMKTSLLIDIHRFSHFTLRSQQEAPKGPTILSRRYLPVNWHRSNLYHVSKHKVLRHCLILWY